MDNNIKKERTSNMVVEPISFEHNTTMVVIGTTLFLMNHIQIQKNHKVQMKLFPEIILFVFMLIHKTIITTI